MNKQFVIIMAIAVALFGGIIFTQKKSDNSQTSSVEPSSYTYGVDPEAVDDAAVVVNLTEYGDFQCPGCGSYFPVVKEIKEKYKDQLTFQFRNFPLTSLHPNAFAAHRSAVAAGNQEKFFEMHDLLYERQAAWSSSTNPSQVFRGYAEELGLDMEKYDVDVASEATNAIIQADLSAGRALNITGTPTFLIDGEVIETPSSIEAFEQVIEDALETKKTS